MECEVHTEKFQAITELMNETLLILICYHVVLFTNLIDDDDMLVSVGYSLVAHLCLLLAVNICIMIGVNLMVGCRALRRYNLRRKRDAMIRARLLNQ